MKANGFPPKDWKKIYDAPYNKKLRKLRPDPKVILPGDIVCLPRYSMEDIQGILDSIIGAQKRLEEVKKERAEVWEQIVRMRIRVKANGMPGEFELEEINKRVKHLDEWIKQIIGDIAGEDKRTTMWGLQAIAMLLWEQKGLIEKAAKIADGLTREKKHVEIRVKELSGLMKDASKTRKRDNR